MNPFDQFDQKSNPFDAFDAPAPSKFTKDAQGRNVIPPEQAIGATESALARIKIPDWMNSLLSTTRSGMQGMADPTVGAVQLAANMLGQGEAVNKAIAENEKKQSALKFNENGWDTAARIAGNVASPVNMLPAVRLAGGAPVVAAASKAPATVRGMAAQGAGYGAIGAAIDPVLSGDNYWGEKGEKLAAGTAAGAVFGPVVGKSVEYLASLRNTGNRLTADDVTNSLRTALAEVGQDISSLQQGQIERLQTQVLAALQGGKKLDPQALLREADFASLGIKPTQGQITRDPMQFAAEQNLRGVSGVGEPLAARFSEQAAEIQRRINELSPGAKNAFQAGEQLTGTLGNIDDILSQHVSGLYREARQSAGKDLDVPLAGLAQDYARILGDFGDSVPGAIRGKFAELGLDPLNPSNQRKLFTVESADQLLKTINKNQSNDPAVNRALSELRAAVKGAVEGAAPDGGVFAPAVKAAAGRFKLQEAIPALGAVVEGRASPDDFVQRFLVNGKTNDVKGLADALRKTDPDSFNEARAQIAEVIKEAAFGTIQAGGDRIAADRFAKTLKKLGPDKLQAFFTPKEVSDLMTMARVQAYISKEPAGAAVNRSNTAGALMNLVGNVPGMSLPVALVNKGIQTAGERRTVSRALSSQAMPEKLPLSDARRNQLLRFLAPGGLAVGGAVSTFTE